MPVLETGFEPVTFLPESGIFLLTASPENHAAPGTPSVVEHYVGRAGPDPGYVNLPPSTVGIGGPLISPKNTNHIAADDALWLRHNGGPP